MGHFTIEQRMEIVKIRYRNGENFAEGVRKCLKCFGHHHAPSRSVVVNLINKFETMNVYTNVRPFQFITVLNN